MLSSVPSLSARSSSATSRSTPAIIARPSIQPSQIHDLKLRSQQRQQQARVLRTQLNRTNILIYAKTTVINKTFVQAGIPPQTSKSIHQTTIQNLRRSVDSARNTLQALCEEIDRLSKDDRSSTVEELEEELKMTHCEAARLGILVAEKQGDRDFYLAERERKLQGSSTEHANALKAEINSVWNENAILRSKARSYQLKLEKIASEEEIREKLDKEVGVAAIVEQAELKFAEKQRRMDRILAALGKEQAQFEQSVSELTALIDGMKAKIRSGMDDEEVK
jgi:hypothetical protein